MQPPRAAGAGGASGASAAAASPRRLAMGLESGRILLIDMPRNNAAAGVAGGGGATGTAPVALGAGASLLGGMLLRWKYELGLAGGALIVLFGLVMMGAIKIPAMMRDTRPDVKVDGGSTVGAYLLGLAFACTQARRNGLHM